MKKLMTANEAIALGFYEAGGVLASAYPGTPSTEILENISQYKDELYCEWSSNEKTALETAIGAAAGGVRALAAMKHVGLNVAADPLFTLSYTGVNGGLVIISADDPSMHSSQNEQDNRHYARAAKVCMLEPADSQEAKDMVMAAFEISERFDVPVILRSTTRVCHSKSLVEVGERKAAQPRPYVKDRSKWDTIPAISKGLRIKLEQRQNALAEYSETCPFNYAIDNNSKIGIVCSGVAFQYAREVFGDTANYFKVGFSYPMPMESIRAFAKNVETLYVVEELDPFMEDQMKAAGISCIGKEKLPAIGELNAGILRSCLLGQKSETITVDTPVVPRAPALCAGCPHRGLFLELSKYGKDVIVSGDIGCYALGGSDPYNTKDTSICMGASISMAHGMKIALDSYGDKRTPVAVIGDSTFFHSGMTSLAGQLYNKGKAVTVIVDNRTTGMTGHQENPGTGYTLMGEPTNAISIEKVVRALGAENVRVVNPLHLSEVREALKWAMELDGPSVIITRYPCALKKYTPEDKNEFGPLGKCVVEHNKCIGCRLCVKTGCPALVFDKATRKVTIDTAQCTGCEICSQVCPKQAIRKEG